MKANETRKLRNHPFQSQKKLFVWFLFFYYYFSVRCKSIIDIEKLKTITIHKIPERNSSFYVKQRTTGKIQFLFLSSSLLILTKFSFWEEDRPLGYNSMKF